MYGACMITEPLSRVLVLTGVLLFDGTDRLPREDMTLVIRGSVLDFVDTLQESGFKIENPNASNTCGCGQSFAA